MLGDSGRVGPGGVDEWQQVVNGCTAGTWCNLLMAPYHRIPLRWSTPCSQSQPHLLNPHWLPLNYHYPPTSWALQVEKFVALGGLGAATGAGSAHAGGGARDDGHATGAGAEGSGAAGGPGSAAAAAVALAAASGAAQGPSTQAAGEHGLGPAAAHSGLDGHGRADGVSGSGLPSAFSEGTHITGHGPGPGPGSTTAAAGAAGHHPPPQHAPPPGALQVQRTFTGGEQPISPAVRMALHVGVLHYSPSHDVFPLLADPAKWVL